MHTSSAGTDSFSSARNRPDADDQLDTRELTPRSRSIVLLLLLAFTFLAPLPGALVWYVMHRREESRVGTRFDEHLADRAWSLREKVAAVGETLYSVRSHFHASDEVTRKEFATFTSETRLRFPAFQALGWAVHVTDEERAAHEAEVRSAGLPDYEIRVRNQAGEMVRAPRAAEYCPVLFLEPAAGNGASIGFDLWSETPIRDALDAAIESDTAEFSPRIRRSSAAESGPEVVALIPVLWLHGESPVGEADHLQGFALIFLPIAKLVTWAFPEQEHPRLMEYQLISVDRGGAETVLYRNSDAADGSRPWPRSLPIEAGGQRWRLDARPTAAFEAETRDSLPMTLGVAAVVLWGLLFGNLYLITRWSQGREMKKRDRIVRSVLANLSEGVIVADGRGAIQLTNDAAAAIVGPRDSTGNTDSLAAVLGCYKPDTVTKYPTEELPITRAMRGETVQEEQIYVRPTRAESGRWLAVSGTPLRDTNQSLLGGVAVIRDITEHKKAEDILKRLSNAVEQTADVVFITNRGGTIEYVNPAFEETFGYTRDEAIGQTPRILRSGVHEREHYRNLWNTILAGRVFHSLTINRKKNGELIHTVQTITPMKDDHGRVTHFVSVCKDITERRRREEHEAELRVASLVQQRLFPEDSLKLKGVDLAGGAFPAAATCGDYFDFFGFSDGGILMAIGDVCGHGLGAALLMAETRAYLRSLARSRSKLPQAFEILNKSISEDVESGVFVTLLAAHLDREDRSLVYASAGHVPGYILGKDGEVRQDLPPTGPALGIMEDQHCRGSARIPLAAGDLVLLLTDGVTETRSPDGRFFEAEGALSIIRQYRQAPAREIVSRIYEGTRAFAGTRPQRDDITMVVCRVEE